MLINVNVFWNSGDVSIFQFYNKEDALKFKEAIECEISCSKAIVIAP